MIAILDNYDSFTYNLVQRIGELDAGADLRVFRNDKVTVEELERLEPTHLIISPGPGTPLDGGISNDAIRRFAGRIPILGVCLGHQCIAYAFGGEVVRADRLMHGKTSLIHHDGRTIFEGIPNPFEATRYHSLIVRPGTVPEEFEVSARTDEDEIMGLRHRRWPVEGVQFHPESFLTAVGPNLLRNFLRL
ncbi:MAG TPA: aminodeoxychorismate/anthranilate synthase component II [Phycisphaerae bacterium]|nr:aminodeoxychorismate/anthranilate synthase component II [Phycisphaerae bacterium]